MNKLVLGLALAGTLGLAGCTDGPKDPQIPDGTAGSGGGGGVALTKLVYAPGDGNIPLPNDLLFSGSLDLTLNLPVEDENDTSDPLVALSTQDGWSAIAPIAMSFSNTDDDIDIDAATIVPGSTVRMFKTVVARPEVSPGILAPTGPVVGIESELVAGVDYVATYAGPGSVVIIPLKPLEQQANYMVVATNGITDTRGNAVIADGQYTVAKSEQPIPQGQNLPTEALEPVRQLVNAMETAAESAGINKDDIVVSFQFTVQSVGTVMNTAKLAYIDLPFSQGAAAPTSFTPMNIPSNMVNPALTGDALISVGQITLPYMLGVPENANDTVVVSDHWTALPILLDENGQPQLDGNGAPVANPLGSNLTYANRLPEQPVSETVPLLVSLPSNAACPKPYPVVIFQHGITSNRTAMLGIADAFAQACMAAVAMDMPLHGVDAQSGGIFFTGYDTSTVHERTFGIDLLNQTGAVDGDGNPLPVDGIPDSSGAHTINLLNLQVARDNLRQSIFDLLSLEKAVPFMDVDGDMVPDFDANNISFMGHSLGGIVGSSFLAYSDMVKTAVLANPGGGIAGLLDASLTFGPVIQGGLASAGIEPGSADYQSFLLAAQTMIDSADPDNTAMTAIANDIPTLLFRVRDDSVVPNNSPTAPLSGTDPLAALLGLSPLVANVDADGNPVAGAVVVNGRVVSRINSGLHSTVLTPLDAEGNPTFYNQTVEMQTEAVSFLASGGQAVSVVDPSLLD